MNHPLMSRVVRTTFLGAALLLAAPVGAADDLKVKITASLPTVTVKHGERKVTIQRDQNQEATVVSDFALTSRACPPFCIQPMELAPGVDTIGELEILDYLKRKSDGDASILVIDSRTADWVERGTIPGSENIPWTELNPARDGDPFSIADILEKRFGVRAQEGLWDYSGAKTLVMFCNGPWCGQSPANIRTLLKFGYPPHKLKWYRGGLQSWSSLGLTTVKAE